MEDLRDSKRERVRFGRREIPVQILHDYWEVRLRLSRQVWDEAMLCAAIRFLVEELGIRRIFYHTPESGAFYKGYGAEGAPRSLYTKLPKRFCFQSVEEGPGFLRKTGRRAKKLGFHFLCL